MVVFLIDADNLSAAAWIDEACHRLEDDEGSVAIRRAYGSAENLKGLAEVLRVWAIRPFVNLSLSKNTTDIALAVDAMELACQMPKPTVLALGSGDADFVPLVVRLRERGIRMVCVSERSKMAQEAAHAYDQVIFVGSGQGSNDTQAPRVTTETSRSASIAPPASKAAAKKSPAKKVAAKSVPAKKVASKKLDADQRTAAGSKVTVLAILAAAPALKTGHWLRLGDVAKSLHDAMLLGKNAASTRLFNKHPHHFELTPVKQPNQVRYILPTK